MAGHVRTSQGPQKHLRRQRVNMNNTSTAFKISTFIYKWLIVFVNINVLGTNITNNEHFLNNINKD